MKFTYLFLAIMMSISFTYISCSDTEDPMVTEDPMEMDDTDDVDDDADADAGLDAAPSFSLKTTDDSTLSLSDYEDKVLVIFFFGNTCPPCKSVAPDIESRLNQGFSANDNFAIIGGDQWDGTNASVDGFETSTKVTFPLGVQASGTARDFGTTFDRLVVINQRGKVAFKGSNQAANDLDEVVSLVENLLK